MDRKKLNTKELNELVRLVKELVEKDIVGISSTDTRNTITQWLVNIGCRKQAEDFQAKIYKYQTSKKIEKLTREYNS